MEVFKVLGCSHKAVGWGGKPGTGAPGPFCGWPSYESPMPGAPVARSPVQHVPGNAMLGSTWSLTLAELICNGSCDCLLKQENPSSIPFSDMKPERSANQHIAFFPLFGNEWHFRDKSC